MITLTREEAQKLLDGFDRVGWARTEHADILRARLSQPEPEPVAVVLGSLYDGEHGVVMYDLKTNERLEVNTKLYTAPPQRKWQGLTDDDLGVYSDKMEAFARAIEAKLKEKNNA